MSCHDFNYIQIQRILRLRIRFGICAIELEIALFVGKSTNGE